MTNTERCPHCPKKRMKGRRTCGDARCQSPLLKEANDRYRERNGKYPWE